MQNNLIVRPEYLNHYGYLFGGYLLKWVDEFAWLCAIDDFPKSKFVTVGLDKVVFKEQIINGTILTFSSNQVHRGTTSITYQVNVKSRIPESSEHKSVFTTNITLVSVDKCGKKTPLVD